MGNKSTQPNNYSLIDSGLLLQYKNDLKFPKQDFEQLLFDLGWPNSLAWLEHWSQNDVQNLCMYSRPRFTRPDWILGIGLTLLSDIERFLNSEANQIIFGISGLPGCGKTTLGKWIEHCSSELKWPVCVVSLDDFYLPATEMEKAMSNNPWNVPRGLPGSHSIDLMLSAIDKWEQTGVLITPRFEKSLRGGLGDRYGWRKSKPKLIIIEGWFVGCDQASNPESIDQEKDLFPPLSTEEKYYREVVQHALERYQPIWKKLERIWQIKPIDFISTCTWKKEQEINMEIKKGSSLKGEKLESFIRMIQAAIPQKSLLSIKADVIAIINTKRQVKWLGRNSQENAQSTIL